MRLADVAPDGRARLDAVARWLQDVAADDVEDGWDGEDIGWVVRRTRLWLVARPRQGDRLHLSTWVSGMALAWTERRTTVSSTGGGGAALVEAETLWVCVDPATQRPARIPDRFASVWAGGSAPGRPDARLRHSDPPAGAVELPWSVRRSDLDVYTHLNNAAAWAVAEEVVPAGTLPVVRAEAEYRAPVRHGGRTRLLASPGVERSHVWLVDDDAVCLSLVLVHRAGQAPGT